MRTNLQTASTGNHWVTLSISTKYNQIWYCDSLKPTDPITGDRLTHNWTDIMTVLNVYDMCTTSPCAQDTFPVSYVVY
jgi:hypothetical protein